MNVFRLKNPWMIFTRRCVLGHWYRVSEFVFGILIRFLSTYKWSIIWFECKWLVACSCQIVRLTSNWTCPYKLFLFWVLLVRFIMDNGSKNCSCPKKLGVGISVWIRFGLVNLGFIKLNPIKTKVALVWVWFGFSLVRFSLV